MSPEPVPPSSSSSPSPENAQVRRFGCPGCGATLTFAPGIQRLKCEYCDHEQDIPADGSAISGAVERPLQELLQGGVRTGWGRQTFNFQCKDCGATVALAEQQTSGRCAFCDSDVVLEKPANPDVITPETLIPFKGDRRDAARVFQGWLRGLWFRPSNLARMAYLQDIKGVYCPFWTFDAQASSRWSAESGYHYYVTESVTNDDGSTETRQVQYTRWEPSWGEHAQFYDDVLVCASKGMAPEHIRNLEPFNTRTQLVPYRPEYLSGWLAEEYAVGPQEGWQRGHAEMERLEYRACDGMVPGDEHRGLSVATRLDHVTWKHVLLPVWIAAYRYNGKAYRFMINGETGRVSGEAPLSWVKIGLLLVAISALITLLVYLAQG